MTSNKKINSNDQKRRNKAIMQKDLKILNIEGRRKLKYTKLMAGKNQ